MFSKGMTFFAVLTKFWLWGVGFFVAAVFSMETNRASDHGEPGERASHHKIFLLFHSIVSIWKKTFNSFFDCLS
jgi:hypothetical protein